VVFLFVAACGLFVMAGWTVRSDNRARSLQREGVRTEATIVAVDARPVGRGRFLDGSVRVRFAASGQSQERSVYVGKSVGDYQLNQQVTVVYDDSNPAHVELLGVTMSGRGVPLVLALAGAVLLAGMAIVAARHVRHIALVVRHEPWEAVRSRLVRVPLTFGLRRGSRVLVELETSSGPVTVEPIGLSRVDARFAPEAWVAGLGTKTMVLAAPGGGHVVPVRRLTGPPPTGR
jgi:hypothetical protein